MIFQADDQMEVESDESEDEEDGEGIDFDNAPTPPLPEGDLQVKKHRKCS